MQKKRAQVVVDKKINETESLQFKRNVAWYYTVQCQLQKIFEISSIDEETEALFCGGKFLISLKSP